MQRRDFIRASMVVGAASAAARRTSAAPDGAGSPERARRVRLASLDELGPGTAKLTGYPDESEPVYVLALRRPTDGGVGPKRNIVAFSARCMHRGCQVIFREDRFICPCHYSAYDPAARGARYQGLATEDLPQLSLEVVDGEVYATGVRSLPWGAVRSR